MPRGRPARRMRFQRRTCDQALFGYFLCRSKLQAAISRRGSFPDPWLFQPDESFPKARLSSLGKHPLSRCHTSWPYAKLQPVPGQYEIRGRQVSTKLEVGLPKDTGVFGRAALSLITGEPQHKDTEAHGRHLSVTWDTGVAPPQQNQNFSKLGFFTPVCQHTCVLIPIDRARKLLHPVFYHRLQAIDYGSLIALLISANSSRAGLGFR